MYKKIMRLARGKIKKISNYLSVNPSDVILASYPRSGSTWLRFIISNIIKNYLSLPFDIDFYTVEKTFPDIHQTLLNSVPSFVPFPKFIKTHDKYKKKYGTIIYLYRNPIEVMKSYFLFIKNRKKSRMTKMEFLSSKKYGIRSWISHANSYYGNIDILINYREMKKATYREIIKIADFLKRNNSIEISKSIIEKSIKQSSRKKMKHLENTQGIPTPISNYKFIGPKGGRNIHFSNQEIAYIIKSLKKSLYNNEIKELLIKELNL